jgi:type IV secretory pathway protease TraF
MDRRRRTANSLLRAAISAHATRVATVAVVAIGGFAVAHCCNHRGALLLENDSPSEPEGLYVRTAEAPAAGRLAAFMTPAAATDYVDRRLANLRRTPVLKALAAGPGSFVCTASGKVVIDGRVMAPVAVRDPRGALLPQWKGCRRLGRGEWFAYSDRVANSFDSRYYGPIRTGQVIAVYRPLWVDARRRG